MTLRRRRLALAVSQIFLLAMAAVSCTSSTSPSPLNLAGTWSGTIGSGSGGGRAVRVTWVISQSDATVSGPATLSTSPAIGSVSFAGLLAGTLHGPVVSLALTSSPGYVPGFPNCALSGRGTGTASGSSISGTLDVIYTSCEGANVQPPASDQFLFTKQQ
jgi:hypothetical protein